jgi:adenylate cyclase
VIFSEGLHDEVKGTFPCRLLDSVAVKGRKAGVKIYTARKSLAPAQSDGWGLHDRGMKEYYERNFTRAAAYFRDALKAMPDDPVSAMLLKRSQTYQTTPPPQEWDGVEVMTHK